MSVSQGGVLYLILFKYTPYYTTLYGVYIHSPMDYLFGKLSSNSSSTCEFSNGRYPKELTREDYSELRTKSYSEILIVLYKGWTIKTVRYPKILQVILISEYI